MSSLIRQSFTSLTRCISPLTCYGCGVAVSHDYDFGCPTCMERLPYTEFHLLQTNTFIDKFFGRIPIYSAGSLLYFSKDGIARAMIHDLKYKDKPEIGIALGIHYGHILSGTELFKDIDMIIPVPLHLSRLSFRGYNQSKVFGEGLSIAMDIPMRTDLVCRHRKTKTQTKKTRVERFANVDGAFGVLKPNVLSGRHILLVDDVLTTGATLEGCAQEIIKVPGVRLSMATIGLAFQ